jgi:Zn-dependent protease with chaperone function
MSTPEAGPLQAGSMPAGSAATAANRYTLRDPETFFQAQKRNRRATWRMSALTGFAAFVMGIPLTLVLTPLLYAMALFAAEVFNRFISPLPPEFWQAANDLAKFGARIADFVFQQRGTLDQQEIALGLLLVLGPGMALAFALWTGMLLLFRHGGVGGTLASMNAREPNQADLKELQLADVVQEMAIAAGLPAPKLMLIDTPGANAAAVGTSPDDARIVLSRRLLDDMDRDELQALLAHLMASIGNGDLGIAFKVTSVFETCGLILTIINAPFGKNSRTALWRLIRYSLTGGSALKKAADAEEVADLLGDTLDTQNSDIERFFNQQNPGLIQKASRLCLFPFMITNIAVELTLWCFLNALLGPCMALLWRTRRYLADAGAVEFTRNPDALARALQRLSEARTTIDGGAWASHLFVVNPQGDSSLRGAPESDDQWRKAVQAWQMTASLGGAVAAANTEPDNNEYLRLRKEMTATGMAAFSGNPAAMARMQAFAQAMGGDAEMELHNIPNVNDLLLARQGDRAAIARLRTQRLQQRQQQPGSPNKGRTGLQTHSFLSFHPPLDKRAKRLNKMGARLVAPGRNWGPIMTVFMALIYAIGAAAFTFLGAVMLFLLVLMIGLNLLFLTLWLSVIHWAFAQDWNANFEAIGKVIGQIINAFSNRR